MKLKDTTYGDQSNKEFMGVYQVICSDLSSLEGRPEKMTGDFLIYKNRLKTLKYRPKIIKDGSFFCYKNLLTSLEGSPKKVKKYFNCSNNQLISLEGRPESVGEFDCSFNKLKSLTYSPNVKTGFYKCSNNSLTSLEGIQKEIKGNFDCSFNKLRTLEFAPNIISGYFDCRYNLKLKNIKDQIIKYNIKATKYYTDEEDFTFEEIKSELLKRRNIILNKTDYGLSI